jgi:creatinine amidohydrolase
MVEKYLFSNLTWPEVKEIVKQNRVAILPVGAIEPHGKHLPLDTDVFLVKSICVEAARQATKDMVVLPPISYGYVPHVMDFPGAINNNYLIELIKDIGISLADHGFHKILIVNGHGSNRPFLDIASRKVNLERDVLCAVVTYWNLASKTANEIRESPIGGMAHAGEFETSLYLYLAEEHVDMNNAISEFSEDPLEFEARDLVAPEWGPLQVFHWSSRRTKNMVVGDATVATTEKGKIIFDDCVKNLIRLVKYFKDKPILPRVDQH